MGMVVVVVSMIRIQTIVEMGGGGGGGRISGRDCGVRRPTKAIPPAPSRTHHEHEEHQQPIVPQLIEVECQIYTASNRTTVLILRADVVLRHPINLECAVLVCIALWSNMMNRSTRAGHRNESNY